MDLERVTQETELATSWGSQIQFKKKTNNILMSIELPAQEYIILAIEQEGNVNREKCNLTVGIQVIQEIESSFRLKYSDRRNPSRSQI